MDFTQQDQDALYQTWMSQKAKLRITQMEFAKKLGLTQVEFSQRVRGKQPLDSQFVQTFCNQLGLDPTQIIPSLKPHNQWLGECVKLTTRLTIDGTIERAYIEGNDVVVEYSHQITQ